MQSLPPADEKVGAGGTATAEPQRDDARPATAGVTHATWATMFNLTRYFSTLSFILIVLAGGLLGSLFNRTAIHQLITEAENYNEVMAQVFQNSLWIRFARFVDQSYVLDAEALRQLEEGLRLRSAVIALMANTPVVKVKLYNRKGMTIFSTDPKQIGEDKSGNPGFRQAQEGRTATELVHRNSFDSYEGMRTDIDIVFSYVPVIDQHDKVVGVFELYYDVTKTVGEIKRTLWRVSGIVIGVLALLFLMQLMVVRRAQGTLRQQSAALEEANRELDRRVQERTAELQAEIAERRNAETRLDHLAHHDPLTGLPNRLMFAEQLKKSIALAGRHGRQLAVLFIDLDRFKEVNDTLGHSIGDKLLVDVAHRLVTRLRTGDTLARLGGDEFICILEDVGEAAEAGRVADLLIELLSNPFQVAGCELYIAASIGICLYPVDGEDADTLVRNADTAMYQAKAHGRGCNHFYTPEMTLYAQERARMEMLLRRAIEADELEVNYQLKVDVKGLPTGCEALLRWHSAELGTISPVRFIPLAEETGFIVELGEWVLRASCLQLVAWRTAGLAIPKVSVNLSVKQIERSDVVDMVNRVLKETGLEPAGLELEITESAIMNTENALTVLQKLSALGVKLAVDDFGTGYSSLAYLKLLPIDTLKIDRSFIVGINGGQGDEAIIRTIMALARSLGFSTVAEGVDDESQLNFLAAQNCDEIQGFYFAQPLPADTFARTWQERA